METFNERERNVLSPHCPTDCAIEIVAGAKLPKPKMYSIIPKEMMELRDYIDKKI